MTRVIRFDAPPPRGADPRINVRYDAPQPLRQPPPRASRVDSKELLAIANRMLRGNLAPNELSAITRRLDEMKELPLSPALGGGTAKVPAANAPAGSASVNDRLMAAWGRLRAAMTPAERLSIIGELAATGKVSAAEIEKLKAWASGLSSGSASPAPSAVLDSSGARRWSASEDALANRLVERGRAPITARLDELESRREHDDRADKEAQASGMSLQERLVARGRAPLGKR